MLSFTIYLSVPRGVGGLYLLELRMEVPYELIGEAAVYITLIALAALLAAIVLGLYSFKQILFPNFVLFMLDLLYSPAKGICRMFSIRSTLIDEIMVEIRNGVFLKDFREIREGKILVGPQCMRHPECKARCDPRIGYICMGCGKCDFSRLKKECEGRGYEMFIVPGDSFVRKIVKMRRPNAALGIACFEELNESMHDLSPTLPVQGVALLRDGCFKTAVNVEDVIDKMM